MKVILLQLVLHFILWIWLATPFAIYSFCSGWALNTSIWYFPANATDLVQPADRFPIQKIKTFWRKLSEKRNMQAICDGDWMQGTGSSGTLTNLCERFYLELAAECVRLANEEQTKDGMNYARKSVTLCGLSLPNNGIWTMEMQRSLRIHKASPTTLYWWH